MDVTGLYKQMAAFARWKQDLLGQLAEFEAWANTYRIGNTDAGYCLQQARQALNDDSVTLALIGEFSRGKTEIINALLFDSYGQRLLPSNPGRTTMCPTELFFDGASPRDCVRLLPIETLRSNSSLSCFKRIPQNWVSVAFDSNNPVDVAKAMGQISRVKCVSDTEALALGFKPEALLRNAQGEVEIPAWRHALVNIEHPLLRHGLRILDTPGLNALGNEPELTLSHLHQARAILFLLAADTGVSITDMQLWREHVALLRTTNGNSTDSTHANSVSSINHDESSKGAVIIALLNKIDTLWDELQSPSDIDLTLHSLRQATARQLQLPIAQVAAISARQGLLAKAAGDSQRLQRSCLPELESQLAQIVINHQQQLATSTAVRDIQAMMLTTRNCLKQSLFAADKELEQLQLQFCDSDFSATLIRQRQQVKAHQLHVHRLALNLRTEQKQLGKHHQQLQVLTRPQLLDELIDATQARLKTSWTGKGAAQAVADYFQQLQQHFALVEQEAKASNVTLQRTYERTCQGHPEANSSLLQQHLLDINPHLIRLRQLNLQAEQFLRNLPALGQRKRLITRFVQSLMQESRHLVASLGADIDSWFALALAPLHHQTAQQKQLLEQQILQLTHLSRVEQTDTEKDQRLQQLRAHIARHEDALFALDGILRKVRISPSMPVIEAAALSA